MNPYDDHQDTFVKTARAMDQLVQQNAALHEQLRQARSVGQALLRERMSSAPPGTYFGGAGTEGKDIVVCERCNKFVCEEVEGIIETRTKWEQKIRDLREALFEIEHCLSLYDDGGALDAREIAEAALYPETDCK